MHENYLPLYWLAWIQLDVELPFRDLSFCATTLAYNLVLASH